MLNDGKWSKLFKTYYNVGFALVALRRDADGELGGFAITNNYARHYCLTRPPWPCFYPAGAIHCDAYSNASPTIRNCIITGGTAEVSKSCFGEPVCEVVVAGDVNGDCEINF